MKTLIGVDFGESSIAAVGWVSRWFLPQSPLALAYGVWMPELPSFAEPPDTERQMLLEQAKQEGRNALAPLVQEHGPSRTEALVGEGTPAEALLTLADEWGAELIAVGPHGHSRILTGFFGSTASRLLRQSKVPVLVVRNAEAGTPDRILVALDEGESTGSVVEAALDVAAAHDCSITGFYSLDTPSDARPAVDGEGPEPDRDLCDAATRWLEEELVQAGIPSPEAKATVGTGSAGRAICSAAAHDADLIVMGTRGATGGSSLGSVARYVVAHAPCPVLVVPVNND